MTLQERLEARLEKLPNGCLVWTGFTLSNGYGQIYADGRAKGTHRVAYEIYVGSIPDGMHVCHHCDNPPCCNPEHLFVGTNLENRRDSVRKGRTPRGERSGTAKLTEDAVRSIRADAGRTPQRKLAKRFGVSQRAILSVLKQETWRGI